MEAREYVEKYREDLLGSGVLKLAQDYAAFLDGPMLNPERFGEGMARTRLKVFDLFCAIFAKTGLPIPPLERRVVEAMQPQATTEFEPQMTGLSAKARLLAERVRAALADRTGPEADDCLAIARTVEMIPSIIWSWGSDSTAPVSVINNRLMRLGLDPLRPDFSEMKIGGSSGCSGPDRDLTVLIVDDEPGMIVTTFRALAGWPGLTFDALLVENDIGGSSQELLAAVTGSILERSPDIVLMDQGMLPISGSRVIQCVRENRVSSEEPPLVFVGNTGGSANELRQAGAIGNLDKGRDISPMFQAIGRATR